MIRRVGLVLGALLLSVPALAQTKIAVGYGFASDFLPALVAQDEGIYARHGLEVTLSVVQSSSMAPAILNSGSLQIAINTPPNLILAVAGGLDQVAIAGAARLTKENQRIGLVTRPGLTVREAADLRGKKVGVPGINSVIDMFLKKWLLDHDVPLDQVTLNEVVAPQMGDMLKSGQLDAAAIFEPLLTRFVATGSAARSVDYFSQVNPDVVASFWAATRAWATANSQPVAAFRASLIEAQTYMGQNPGPTKEIENKYLHFTEAGFPTYKVDMTPADLDFFVAVSRQLGLIQQPIDTARLVFK